MLLPIKKVPLPKEVFPHTWQTVIFRNYGLISTEKIAKTLECDEATVELEAKRMGLGGAQFDGRWERRGFITLVRNNWYLLPYEQLKTLLDYDDERLEFVLFKEDFLDVKLGNFKPECPKVVYTPLTEEEKTRTEMLADEVQAYLPNTSSAFEFFKENSVTEIPVKGTANKIRLIHGYLTPCGDALIMDDEEYLPEALLREYQKQGINGFWLHGLLSALSPYPFDPALSEEYLLRRKNLQKLVDRCAKYGIKVYLYMNEPRFLPVDKIGKYAHLQGTTFRGKACLCFEKEEVRDYLYSAMKDLFTDVKGLGGVITITMSENPTHCNWAPIGGEADAQVCPTCGKLPAYRSAVAVNNVIAKALRDADKDAKVLAYLWGWTSYMGWTREETQRAIQALDKDIIAVCVSECELAIEKGGVKNQIVDYSISNPGPSEITQFMFKTAQESGLRCMAKIQTNNSWENSAAPYLPVYDLVLKHLQNLNAHGINEYMLTWTLGGYPSPMLNMVAEYSETPDTFCIQKWYEKQYGADAEKIRQAVRRFCAGFEEYPFHIYCLYFSPKTLGCANLWDLQPQNNASTMVCFAFDDYETWIGGYSYETYMAQYEKLLSAWEEGLALLSETSDSPLLQELKLCAETAYIHFKADYLQTKFSHHKRDIGRYKKELLEILGEEETITKRLLSFLDKMPVIGFETSNHYFYNERNLLEKILQTQMLKKELQG